MRGTTQIALTPQHGGGKLQVWGCMAASGVGTLKVVWGRLMWHIYFNRMEHLAIQQEVQSHGKILRSANGHLKIRISIRLNVFGVQTRR